MKILSGQKDCITDVPRVKVGHETLYQHVNETDTICTGVTAILPHDGDLFTEKVRAASYVINGYGKTTGLIQVDELGIIESPIMLTNTFSVGAVMEGTLHYMLTMNENIGDSVSSLNIVVGECNDSYLNSMRIPAIKPKHAMKAIQSATNKNVKEGAVGAGKGMVCFGYKGGIGTSSKQIIYENNTFVLGCLVLSNFGKQKDAPFITTKNIEDHHVDGSIMIIIATDAPLNERQLKRLCKRSASGLARAGSYYAHGSGDIAIAFTTANTYQHGKDILFETASFLRDDHPIMNLLFQATAETVHNAIFSSLKHAETTFGRKGRIIKKAPL